MKLLQEKKLSRKKWSCFATQSIGLVSKSSKQHTCAKHMALLSLPTPAVLRKCWSPWKWIHSALTKGQRGQAYSYSLKVMAGELTQGITIYRLFGLGCDHCMSCLNNRILNSGRFGYWRGNCSVCSLYHGKAVLLNFLFYFVFAFFPPFWLGYIKLWKINAG